jgi:hypothetical protein
MLDRFIRAALAGQPGDLAAMLKRPFDYWQQHQQEKGEAEALSLDLVALEQQQQQQEEEPAGRWRPGLRGAPTGEAAAMADKCAACSAGSTPSGKPLKKCSACHEVCYCSSECQKKHWRDEHRRTCRAGLPGVTLNLTRGKGLLVGAPDSAV